MTLLYNLIMAAVDLAVLFLVGWKKSRLAWFASVACGGTVALALAIKLGEDHFGSCRLAAWGLALNAWRDSPLWGNGLGSTGVAALRTNPERAFVTESQVLKALVELGLPGFLALGFLWFQIARVGYRGYRAADDPTRRRLLLGILTGLLVVFVEGWVYQNLEVKQVNAYFWTLVGTMAFLTGGRGGDG